MLRTGVGGVRTRSETWVSCVGVWNRAGWLWHGYGTDGSGSVWDGGEVQCAVRGRVLVVLVKWWECSVRGWWGWRG